MLRGRAEDAFRSDVPVDWLITMYLGLVHAAADHAVVHDDPARGGAGAAAVDRGRAVQRFTRTVRVTAFTPGAVIRTR